MGTQALKMLGEPRLGTQAPEMLGEQELGKHALKMLGEPRLGTQALKALGEQLLQTLQLLQVPQLSLQRQVFGKWSSCNLAAFHGDMELAMVLRAMPAKVVMGQIR